MFFSKNNFLFKNLKIMYFSIIYYAIVICSEIIQNVAYDN
jgi:hypothetical protein